MRARDLLTAGGLILLAACRGPAPDAGSEVPLLDGDHAPDVLTESRLLEPPPSLAGNRFVRGWWPRGRGVETRLAPAAGGSRLEVVSLEPRPRTLVLDLELLAPAPAGAAVAVRAGGREAGRFPLASPLEVPLPELPVGRRAVDLEFPAGAEVAVARAGLRRALPAGEVRIDGDEIVQSGFSAVDLVRRAPPGATLTGRFLPPAGARRDQRFAVYLEPSRRTAEGRTPGGSTPVFEWRGGPWSRLRGARELEIPLDPAGGLARVRLLAAGGGPPARWQGLRLRFPQPHPDPVEAATPDPPKLVVLYVLDALRADHLGHLGGDPALTPNLDRLAAAGVTLTGHLSVAPNTLPATRALFTGRTFLTPRGLKAGGLESLAEVFSRAGWRTAMFSDNPYLSTAWGTAAGFDHLDELFRDRSATAGAYNDSAERVHAAARAWLDRLDPEEPAFLYLHTLHPHNPYDPPPRFRPPVGEGSRIGGDTATLVAIQEREREAGAGDRERLQRLYAGALAYNDAEIGSLVAGLERSYGRGEVLVVFTGDHGEELFDHGGVLHGHTLYDEQLRVPLVFWWPGRLAPARIAAASDLLDLHETLRALAGAPPAAGGGRSLWPLLRQGSAAAGKAVRFAAAASLPGGLFMARSERTKLIWAPRAGGAWGMGKGPGRTWDAEYLFDLERDPGETTNLAGDGSLEAAWLRSLLLAWIERGRAREAAVEDRPREIDEENRARLRALGYLD